MSLVFRPTDPFVHFKVLLFNFYKFILNFSQISYILDEESITNPDAFWKKVASNFYFKEWSDQGLEYNFNIKKGDIFVRYLIN